MIFILNITTFSFKQEDEEVEDGDFTKKDFEENNYLGYKTIHSKAEKQQSRLEKYEFPHPLGSYLSLEDISMEFLKV